MQTLVKMEGITKEFPGVKALDNISLEINAGEVHVLLGENGAGTVSYTHLDVYKRQEHAPAMPGSCKDFYFYNLKILPRFQKGLELMFGVELNIMDYTGRVDLPERYMDCTDLRIASLHPPCITPGSIEENTAAMLGLSLIHIL